MGIRHYCAGCLHRLGCILLAVTMATMPSANVLAQTRATKPEAIPRELDLQSDPIQPGPTARAVLAADKTLLAEPGTGKIDLKYLTSGAVAVVVLWPAQIMNAPMAEMLPTEVATAAGLQYLGFDPAHVDEVVAFVEQINPIVPPAYGVTLKFSKPFRAAEIPADLRAHAEEGELDGRQYLQSQDPTLPSFYEVDDHTLVVAPDATLRRLMATPNQAKSGPLIDRVRNVPAVHDLYTAVDLVSLRPLIEMGLIQARAETPAELQRFLDAPGLISAAELTLNLSHPGPSSLVVHADDEAAADKLEALIEEGIQMYRTQMMGQIAELEASEDPVERAMAQYLTRMMGRWTDPFRPERKGQSFVFFRSEGEDPTQQQLTTVAVIGILVALLLPAVQAAREAARRNTSINNMKQLILAFHNYHDVTRSFPAHAIYSDEGQPLLSWRVQILPYLEEQALYDAFRLDEPWDSEHNRALITHMPAVFHCPSSRLDPGMGRTTYVAPVGEGLVFDGTPNGTRMEQITDGTSRTLALVEVADEHAVFWTKPDDLPYDPQAPLTRLSGHHPGVFLAAFADGSVRAISTSIDLETLKALFTRAGGEAVGGDF